QVKSPLAAGLAALAVLVAVPSPSTSAETTPGPDQIGVFSKPFVEPGRNCHKEKIQGRTEKICKPAAVSVVVLPNGRILYWDGLEGFENIQHGTAAEAGDAAVNDQSRVLTLGAHPRWTKPTPVDGGANPNGYHDE